MEFKYVLLIVGWIFLGFFAKGFIGEVLREIKSRRSK